MELDAFMDVLGLVWRDGGFFFLEVWEMERGDTFVLVEMGMI